MNQTVFPCAAQIPSGINSLVSLKYADSLIVEGDQQVLLLLNAAPAGLYHLTVELGELSSTRLFSIVK